MASIGRTRTLEKLRQEGWIYWRVQSYNHWAHKSYDLFGMWDVFAIDPKTARWKGIQICNFGEEKPHITKIAQATWLFEDMGVGIQLLPLWKACGGLAELWSWGKLCRAGRGTRKEWEVRITEL